MNESYVPGSITPRNVNCGKICACTRNRKRFKHAALCKSFWDKVETFLRMNVKILVEMLIFDQSRLRFNK